MYSLKHFGQSAMGISHGKYTENTFLLPFQILFHNYDYKTLQITKRHLNGILNSFIRISSKFMSASLCFMHSNRTAMHFMHCNYSQWYDTTLGRTGRISQWKRGNKKDQN